MSKGVPPLSDLIDNLGAQPMFKIEKGIALPSSARGSDAKYPWADMEVGDSFFAPEAMLKSMRTSIYKQNKKGDAKFIAREDTVKDGKKEIEGVRVWRKA